jgi:hypothetical protein
LWSVDRSAQHLDHDRAENKRRRVMLTDAQLAEIRERTSQLVDEGCMVLDGIPWCHDAARAVASILPDAARYYDGTGYVFIGDTGIPYGHGWVELEDGTIVDAAVEQFRVVEGLTGWPGTEDIAVIPPGHPWQQRYVGSSVLRSIFHEPGSLGLAVAFLDSEPQAYETVDPIPGFDWDGRVESLDGLSLGPIDVRDGALYAYGYRAASVGRNGQVTCHYLPPESHPRGWEIAAVLGQGSSCNPDEKIIKSELAKIKRRVLR